MTGRAGKAAGRFAGKTAAVTGAGDGIGRALALGLAARGAKAVAVSDIDGAAAEATAAMLRAAGAEAHAATLDVSDEAAMGAWAEDVAARFGTVHQLYNNAGIASGAYPVLDCPTADFDRVLQVNLWGVIHGARAFLPLLIDSGDGALVNISSLNGLMAQSNMSAYCTSKFGVRGFTEAVRVEMLLEKKPVQVVVVHPGGVRTGIADRAAAEARRARNFTPEEEALAEARRKVYVEKLLTMPPDVAAAEILSGVARGRSRIVVTRKARSLDRMIRLAPERYPALIADWIRKTFGD
ncbi:SDR family NAD(P)-dependent oxidoreductase [Rhodovulum sp. DZ06]|uniref:SDR family NAD(P)-dependent oxidoreductase n=1 Tax=Rhodovulum sp. DZ06 TaxID=3425126 RepID=UPI003D34F992